MNSLTIVEFIALFAGFSRMDNITYFIIAFGESLNRNYIHNFFLTDFKKGRFKNCKIYTSFIYFRGRSEI